ncbi:MULTISPECIES: hypothetical protein [Prochlorococcus]|uniref:Uncharacterized protein n=1 Tax=Prochlorococcus marinus (strain SARG / CCMP1375 / SS120) TaxID=167539 RepID=Q7VDN0_PROMA|nr:MULTISPECIES: hypothetical protein [Prochlorococcus]AAP99390.1 Predicted protein [Prochlorococcus marinus subsp. marinus str. CCMP1375]KGG11339.1 hypothetical protein EV04_1418 [Prochlorococcus marinus str. LG]KGG18706.1 hypothetical protein EV08_1954 [Prochlorococcus marinus str. SS2]KGG22979.1 hypothetical protein EV09_1721 [Prochlorococcus marinus str. SS35]KGG34083.1 hypothetical protein EV10_0119 [Prochlorococcus marinus str. SS51]
MTIKRPPSNESPGDQSSQTPSGKKVPMAMSMMVDSMVRMIQKGSNNLEDLDSKESLNSKNGD